MPTRISFIRARVRFAALAMGALIGGMGPGSASAAEAFDISRHRGHVVIVDFWASWCKPCRQSIPWLNALRERYGDRGLTIIGVNVDAERGDAERFLRDVPIDFEVVFDPAGAIATRFEVRGMPSSYVFDRSGKLVGTHVGFRVAKRDENEAEIRKLLDQHPQ